MGPIDELTEIFRKFPGIGPRQARRFVYHLLREHGSNRRRLADKINALEGAVVSCNLCGRFFELKKHKTHHAAEHDLTFEPHYSHTRSHTHTSTQTHTHTCPICTDLARAHSLMIVERDADFEKMEKTHVYDGQYFILGGTLTFGDEEGHSKIRLRELEDRVRTMTGLREIIIALNPTPEGDYTAAHVREMLTTYTDARPELVISTLARGLASGVELEYSDQETLKSALTRRY